MLLLLCFSFRANGDGKVYIYPMKNINMHAEDFSLAQNFIFSKLLQNPEFTYLVLSDTGSDSISKPEIGEADLYLEAAVANQRYLLFARINHRSKKHLLTAFQVEAGTAGSDSLTLLAVRLARKMRDFKLSLTPTSSPAKKSSRDTIVVKSQPSAITRENYRNALKQSYFTPSIGARSFFTAISGGYPAQAGFSLKWYFYRNFFCTSALNWYDKESIDLDQNGQMINLNWQYFPLSAGIGFRIKEFRTYPLILSELFINSEQLKCEDKIQLTSNQADISAKALRLSGGLEFTFLFKRNIYLSTSAAYSHFLVYSAETVMKTEDGILQSDIKTKIKEISKPQPLLRVQIGYNFD